MTFPGRIVAGLPPPVATGGFAFVNVPSGTPPAAHIPYGSVAANGSVWFTGSNVDSTVLPTLNQVDPATGIIVAQTVLGAATDSVTGLTWDGVSSLWAYGKIGGVDKLIKIPVANPASFVAYTITGVTGASGNLVYENGNIWLADYGAADVKRYLASAPAAPTATVITNTQPNVLVYDPNTAHYADVQPRLFVQSSGFIERIELGTPAVDDSLALANVDWISLGNVELYCSSAVAQEVYTVDLEPMALNLTFNYAPDYTPSMVMYNAALSKFFMVSLTGVSDTSITRHSLAGAQEAVVILPGLVPYPSSLVLANGIAADPTIWLPLVVADKYYAFSTLGAVDITAREVTSPLVTSWVAPSGDLSGSFAAPQVTRLVGNPLDVSLLTGGSIMVYYTGAWHTPPVTGDLDVSAPAATIVRGLRGTTIDPAMPVNPGIGAYLRYGASGWNREGSGQTQSTATLTGSVNDYVLPTLPDIVRIASNGAYNITGLNYNIAQIQKTLVNVSAFTLTLKHESASSSVGYRFKLKGAADFLLLADAAVTIWYDNTDSRWRLF